MAGRSPSPSQAGATPNRLKRKAPASSAVPSSSTSLGADQAADEEDIEELEREVADLGRRILEHRRDAAARFIDATVSRLVALRPPACLVEVPVEAQPAVGTSHAEAEQNITEKLKLFKSKTEANIAAMPKVLERMNECVARMEKVEQLNLNIHPVFQRRR
ncbi:hypothetical protein CFC21_018438 [Triticum aestivum]|uniref:Uncharacterized protein n=3 Tax=Triticum TaxID=4564 RepID=A0A9R1P2N1_TRITD|nr:uncharacterized protein LOC119358073 [Triticum dicoccoides]XP_044453605.1 uncharacterized protein LOC123185856 isoform X1 [Triticum aestivum]KAF7003056.1 hypothetical protein CFC21_018438 [Triticum aestivum]VAH35322.1 unnamed protein product [Triticum turgidum subsp. durum]